MRQRLSGTFQSITQSISLYCIAPICNKSYLIRLSSGGEVGWVTFIQETGNESSVLEKAHGDYFKTCKILTPTLTTEVSKVFTFIMQVEV